MNLRAQTLVGAKTPGHTACTQGEKENEHTEGSHIQHPGQDCDPKPTSNTLPSPLSLTAQQPSLCRKQSCDWWGAGQGLPVRAYSAKTLVPAHSPMSHVAWRQRFPLQLKQALNDSNPPASASWVPGYRCVPIPSYPLFIYVLHVSSLKVSVRSSFHAVPRLFLWLSRSQVRSGYWSCFMCMTWEKLFPF